MAASGNPFEMALENGAKLVREKVVNVKKRGKIWEILTKKNKILTRILVGADGVNSIVRRKTVGSICSKNLALTYGYLADYMEKI